MIITKRYKISDLLDSYDDITARLEGIERHTEKFGPKVCWKITDETITRHSVKIIQNSIKEISPTHLKVALADLANQIDQAHKFSLVHGDLNWKNILQIDYQFKIIDWEPSLRQSIFKKQRLMGTRPYIHPSDDISNILTQKTDLFGFFVFCMFHLSAANYGVAFNKTTLKIAIKNSLLRQGYVVADFIENCPNSERLLEKIFHNLHYWTSEFIA